MKNYNLNYVKDTIGTDCQVGVSQKAKLNKGVTHKNVMESQMSVGSIKMLFDGRISAKGCLISDFRMFGILFQQMGEDYDGIKFLT